MERYFFNLFLINQTTDEKKTKGIIQTKGTWSIFKLSL